MTDFGHPADAIPTDKTALKPAVRWMLPQVLLADWWIAITPEGEAGSPKDLPVGANRQKAPVPGTALDALWEPHLREAGAPPSLHEHDVWYGTVIQALAGDRIRFLGLAGLAEIWLDDECVIRTTSMFIAYTVQVPRSGKITLSIRFRSLKKALAATAGRPRWRTQLVTSNGLRLQRQTLLGHMPGWCPSYDAVGPYRAIEHFSGPGAIESCRLSATLRGGTGVVNLRIEFAEAHDRQADLKVQVGDYFVPLQRVATGSFIAELSLPEVELWWPHTHGEPTLHDVFLVDGTAELLIGRVGFREVRVSRGQDGKGFGLECNGVPIFCRGACWTNADLIRLSSDRDTYIAWIRLVRDADMNMIRVGGTMLYESRAFHNLCDEFGILVWQDLMFANLDYATGQADFRESAVLEIEQLVERLAGSPSLVVLCGGSEIAQQAAFLGLGPDQRAMEFFETFLPELVARLKPDLHYVPHSPWGGPMPFTVNAGVSHYYGVGAYKRPLEDARRAGVRFATECVALANPPAATSPSARRIEEGPRDRGVSWTFVDIRDHYLRDLYKVDPAHLRGEDPERYLDLSRAVTADLVETVFAEWRRPGSTCCGGLIWQLQDLAPCSGWGIIDNHGIPKAAWHGFRRVSAPIQILLSDEGQDGLGIYILNERNAPLEGLVRLAGLKRGSVPVVTAEAAITLEPHGSISISSQDLIEGFFDISRAYRFGPPEHDITIATLHCRRSGEILSEAFHFPLGRALPLNDLGLTAVLSQQDTDWFLDIAASRFAQAVHVEVDGYRADREWFHLPPAVTRRVQLLPGPGVATRPTGFVRALNGVQSASIRECQ
ncbi:glycoside hydrolase family 2 protein [Lichenicola cladoniae]|uniref:Glycoside hydrolase family 2 protein n=1 Tax=Lichenicola cladoniae TaxID=1484109 RepID=A0A6M8HJ92_9PROT|nr:glycoside hydrolase family 2 protein [Lichenicola cladoniae]NPD65154.1 glycoside hydrolase family 2 protein [Acetobacteraceae bacterium]QKE88758.1 glycoside hydrolase family 2 protein [Lichenicola cladoniae]